MRRLSKQRPVPATVDLDALHLQGEDDVVDHELATKVAPVVVVTGVASREPVALAARYREADVRLGRLTRGDATLGDDLVSLVPHVQFLAEFWAARAAATGGPWPSTVTQVATPWGSATCLHQGGVGRPANEALYLAAFYADYLLWNAGVDDPERAARVVRALFAHGFVKSVEHYDPSKTFTAAAPIVRERDSYLRMGRDILGATGSLPLLAMDYRIPPDVDQLVVVVQVLPTSTRVSPSDLVMMVFGTRAMGVDALPLGVEVGPANQKTWEGLVRGLVARGLRPGGIKRLGGVSRGVALSAEALRELAPKAQVSVHRQPTDELQGVAVELAARSVTLIAQRRARRGADHVKEQRIAATEMMRVLVPSPAESAGQSSD